MCNLLFWIFKEWPQAAGKAEVMGKSSQRDKAVESEEVHFSTLRPMGSEPLRMADGLASPCSAWVQCVSSKPASLCEWVCTHLYPLSQDLNEEILWEHTAHQPGLTSDTGADTEPPLSGPHEERARGNLMSERRAGSQTLALPQQLYQQAM